MLSFRKKIAAFKPKTSVQVQTTAVREKGYLKSAEIMLKEINPEGSAKKFVRTLNHTTEGKIEERVYFHQMLGKVPFFGKIEISSNKSGPLGETYFTMLNERPFAYRIHDLETRPWAQKQGVVGQILAETIDVLKKKAGAKQIILTVDMATEKAQDALRLYKGFGFVQPKRNVGKVPKGHVQLVLNL